MNATKEVIKIVAIYLFVFFFIILFVLFPRDASIEVSGQAMVVEYSYDFNLEEYKNNVVSFFKEVYENKSLGGTKFRTRSVEDELQKFLPRSLKVIAIGFFISVIFGILKGIFDYRSKNTKKSILGNGTTWFFSGLPDFFIVICLVYFLLLFIPEINIMGTESWYKFIAPSILISIAPLFYVARVTSVSLQTQDREPHIQVAYSKGFTPGKVLINHMLKPCLITVSSHLQSLMVFLLSNLLVVEYLIGYEGAAYRLFSAIGYSNKIPFFPIREQGLIIGICISFLFLVMIAHIFSQLIKAKLDPK
ncbi:ABC transporter permease subunit [Ferdinandcohnia quinoae]|uniref:ABC transporter permease subunit n=1 Tax=Fredinandcohnia quinoae TaxID=2918902 RepID=A0AAW5EAM0_9BACI|nr:ABC transporter permease subunit [Fredinandcohnia sp. SECRCQ15]MCH1626471.1 ABC transporter permease subunit [Fredinandcohnia sp. SECRCQ15]